MSFSLTPPKLGQLSWCFVLTRLLEPSCQFFLTCQAFKLSRMDMYQVPLEFHQFPRKKKFPFFNQFFNGLIKKLQNVIKSDTKSVSNMGTLVFTLRVSTLPQGPLSTSVEQPEHPVKHYLAKNASRWHFNAKYWTNWHSGQRLKSQKY